MLRNCLHCEKPVNHGRAIYCSNQCQQDHRYASWIERWKQGLESGLIGVTIKALSNHLERYLHEKFNSACSICGWNEVNVYSGSVPVEVDHIDGDYTNNTEANLRLLCPNHHALTSTYKNLNKGHGRPFRRKSIDSDAEDL